MYHPVRPLPQVVVDVAEDDVGTGGFVLLLRRRTWWGYFHPGFLVRNTRVFLVRNPGVFVVKTPGILG